MKPGLFLLSLLLVIGPIQQDLAGVLKTLSQRIARGRQATRIAR
mgnify:CR=1 FL=1